MRVNIPANADELITLLDNIIAKENALAPNGLLNDAELLEVVAIRDAAKTANNLQKQLYRDAEAQTELRNVKLGTNTGANVNLPGTGLYYVTYVRDLGLTKNKQTPHKIGEWGFEVDDAPQGGGTPTPPTP